MIDALPDSVIAANAAAQPASVRGVVNRVSVLLPNRDDPTQSVGGTRVGRFGWKASIATLVQFSADAYLNEMGITTQHCIGGRSIMTFGVESKPNGIAQPAGCGDRGPAARAFPLGSTTASGAARVDSRRSRTTSPSSRDS